MEIRVTIEGKFLHEHNRLVSSFKYTLSIVTDRFIRTLIHNLFGEVIELEPWDCLQLRRKFFEVVDRTG